MIQRAIILTLEKISNDVTTPNVLVRSGLAAQTTTCYLMVGDADSRTRATRGRKNNFYTSNIIYQ